MEESDLKKEYDELLAVYSKKRNECDSIEREIKQIRTDIDELKNKLKDCSTSEPQNNEIITSEAQLQQKQDLIRQQEELTNVLTQLQSLLAQSNEQNHAELKGQVNSLQTLYASLGYKENNQQKEKAAALISELQPKISEEQKLLLSLQKDLDEREQCLKTLQQEVNALQGVNTEGQKQNGENGASIVDLENMLRTLQQEQATIAEDLKRQNSNLVDKIKNHELQQQKKSRQLSQLKANNNNLKNTLNILQEEFKKLQSESPKAGDHSQLATLQATHKTLLRQIEDYTKEVTIKKVEANKKKEEAKKQKNKDKRNFKQEILEEQTLNELLIKELQREEKKLQNTIKVRKSYVPQQNLQILQKQYERQQLKGKPNLQAEQKQRQKLIRENQMIKSRISFLTNAGKEMQKESERKLKELKEKGDDLVKEKLASQKILSQATYKMNEYLRVYPDHEKKKEEAKILEKKRRQEQREEQKLEQQRKAAERREEQKEVLIEKALQEDSNQTAWDKWDKWDKAGNLSKADQGSIFNNRQFQIGAAIVAIIGILLLSFS